MQGLGERHRRGLRHVVDAEIAIRDQAGKARRKQHVAAVACLDHPRNESLGPVNATPEVHLNQPIPIVMSHLVGRAEDSDPGIVHDDFDLAVAIPGEIRQGDDRLAIGNVGDEAARFETFLLQRLDRGVQHRFLDIRQH